MMGNTGVTEMIGKNDCASILKGELAVSVVKSHGNFKLLHVIYIHNTIFLGGSQSCKSLLGP